MMELHITTQAKFDAALTRGDFNRATKVRLDNLPLVTALPAMPRATKVRLDARLRAIR